MFFSDEYSFNDGWKFAVTLASGVEKESYDDRQFKPVELPHDWQIRNRRYPEMELGGNQGYFSREQVGWYRKRFTAPPEWKDKTVYMVIDGCQRFYDVYLNGGRIGGHRYGYVPEIITLNDGLRFGGENLICVKVDNAHTLGDRWYSGAGLYQGIRLLVKNKAHIAPWSLSVSYRLDRNDADVEVRLGTVCTGSGSRIECMLEDKDGRNVGEAAAPADGGLAEVRFKVSRVCRWGINSPYLYRLKLKLISNGCVTDEAEEAIGFRDAVFDADRGFLLNGEQVKLYGANLHHDAGRVFGAVMPKEILRKRLKVLKDMGCNAIRCSHNPQGEMLYNLCDEMGLVVIDELYDKWCNSALYFGQIFDTDRMDDLERMVNRDRNHPCVVLWSVGNEVEIQYSELFYEKLEELVDACHRLDPSRPVSMALIGFCMRGYLDDNTELKKKTDLVLRYADIVDVFMGNYMEGYYEAFREAGMKKAIIGSEVFTYYRNEQLSAFQTVERSPWEDVKKHDYVAGGFVWAGVDYLGECPGWPTFGWPGCPVDSTARRKLRSWFVESQWSEKPVLKLGFIDSKAYDDRARANWGFPLMRGDFYAERYDLMMRVYAMTNCDEVRLYLNNDPVRVCRSYGEDRGMHMLLPYHPGTLRAEGWKDGKKVAEQILLSSDKPVSILIEVPEEKVCPGEIAQIDLYLADEYGQVWERSAPEVSVSVDGKAVLLGVDNGNFLTDDGGPDTSSCAFHLGHATAYVRIVGDEPAVIRASCGEMSAEAIINRG
ncbi:MAG: DUF4982 domain-containing protein [Clostridiales bacterium]|nr:DUF4982 domain-containing protein [Clostridiales bacterium]